MNGSHLCPYVEYIREHIKPPGESDPKLGYCRALRGGRGNMKAMFREEDDDEQTK